jgi:hypothetical protein
MLQLCVCIQGLSGVDISLVVFPDGATFKDVIMNMTPGGPAAKIGKIVVQHEVLSPLCVSITQHIFTHVYVHTLVRVIMIYKKSEEKNNIIYNSIFNVKDRAADDVMSGVLSLYILFSLTQIVCTCVCVCVSLRP